MITRLILCFVLLSICACKNEPTRLHDGTYTYSQNVGHKIKKNQIEIDGRWFNYIIISEKDNSIYKKFEFLFIQHPNKIDVPLRDGRTMTIEVKKDGNIIFDDCRFEKEYPVIITNPIPKAFMENQE